MGATHLSRRPVFSEDKYVRLSSPNHSFPAYTLNDFLCYLCNFLEDIWSMEVPEIILIDMEESQAAAYAEILSVYSRRHVAKLHDES